MTMQIEAQRRFITISAYLGWDHDRLDAILEAVCGMVDGGELDRAEHHFKDFAEGLTRHIRIEEDLLFPAFEAATGIVSGPTVMMRREHREIRRAILLMGDALAGEDPAGFRAARQMLDSVLPDHNLKEERVLYPSADRALDADSREALVARMISLRA